MIGKRYRQILHVKSCVFFIYLGLTLFERAFAYSQLSVLEALPQLLIESFLCQPMHEFVYCVASTIIHYAQGSREIFQPEKFLDRTGNRTRHLRIGNSVPLPTRLSETPITQPYSNQMT